MVNTALAAVPLAHALTLFQDNNMAAMQTMWDTFKLTHQKTYKTPEEEQGKFNTFLTNLKLADERNAQEISVGGSAVHGVTRFSDLSQEEFMATFANLDTTVKQPTLQVHHAPTPVNATMGLVDWTGRYTTPVKNQWYCGSCWAFSATEQMESDAIRQLGYSTQLSTGQVTECTYNRNGCEGGWPTDGYIAVANFGGIENEWDYPYTEYYGEYIGCHADSSRYVLGLSQAWTVGGGEGGMANFVQSTGPLAICLYAGNWNTYTGGIMYWCPSEGAHCVQAVGVQTDGEAFWKVRNSWGDGWGEGGYIRLAYGQNMCGLTMQSSFTEMYRK